MIYIKLLVFFGVCYLTLGISKYREKWVDRLYVRIWGLTPPTSTEIIHLGINYIKAAVLSYLLINM